MKRFAELAIGVLALARAATVAAAPASARVFVGIGAPLLAPIAAPNRFRRAIPTPPTTIPITAARPMWAAR